MKLLLIEDDRSIALALAQVLSNQYEVDVAHSGRNGLAKAQVYTYQLIILDLTLPDMPGLAVCHQLRQGTCQAPILVLSGEAKVLTKISLLDGGADDYLTKPFSLGELKVRLRVLQRRAGNSQPLPNRLAVGDLALDCAGHCVQRAGQNIRLRRKEFALLECLMQHAGTVVTREMLANYAWRDGECPWTNTVDVHIKYLRDKIDRPFAKQLIRTVHGLGYKLEIPSLMVPTAIRPTPEIAGMLTA